jgi:CRISPR-associated endonuclease/helicase Cas3
VKSLPGFDEFFRALWKYDPFPWQVMLADRIAERHWPQALDLPTAAGKTACIDAAIYALACQAGRPIQKRTAPRRIWFVVDRRIVVDEAFERATLIARKLSEAQTGPLHEIAEGLKLVSGTERPLAVARLRGGILRDDGWARLPSQPAVVTSTVDQLGSRLLFRGYGHSHLTAPIYAGLVAHDSLILLDEAHCSVPFLQTLRSIETYRGNKWAESPIVTPFAFAILSATPPGEISEDAVFPGPDRERALNHPVLRSRLAASKPAELVTVKTRGMEDDPLVMEAVARTWSYVNHKQRVAVIVNRVDSAMQIARVLREKSSGEVDVLLLTGRLRPFERDRLVERWKPFLRASSPERVSKPIMLVSTQCIEVGADFSFDALVTQAASLDALRQRFGRLNRMGLPGAAPATIIIRDSDTVKTGEPDPIYENSIAACWELLTQKAIRVGEGNKELRSVDFGFNALDGSLADVDDDDLLKCLAPRHDAPILLPSHLDLLCQTAPLPDPDPDIDLFLHGKDRGAPDVGVVWRADLDSSHTETWQEIVALCSPVSSETLSVPLYRLRAWLTKRASDEYTGDVEGGMTPNDDFGETRPILLWRGRDRSAISRDVRDIRPNDLVVLPAEYGLGNLGQSEPAEVMGAGALDLWEPARSGSGLPPALRIHRAVLQPWLVCPPLNELVLLASDPAKNAESLKEAIDIVLAYEPQSGDELTPPRWLLDLLRSVRDGRIEDHPGDGVVLFARDRARRRRGEPDLFADDDDLTSACGEKVSLVRHSVSVEQAVLKIASRCLPDEFIEPLRFGAYWHDVGKIDERFQLLLHNGDDAAAASATAPLAKSVTVPESPSQRRAIRERCNLPADFRHEMLSFQLTERYAPLPEDKKAADLALHLVATHHGHARPFAPICHDPEPPAVVVSHGGALFELSAKDRAEMCPPHSLSSGHSERFWTLTRRYGWWGLAYLESILRLGDWYGSQWVVPESHALESAAASQAYVGNPPTRLVEPSFELTGLDGANPLAFLAAIGTLVVLGREAPSARLSWCRSAIWVPVLSGVATENQHTLCTLLADALRGRPVANDEDENRRQAQEEFDAAKKAVAKKLNEIKRRRLRGSERRAVFEAEVQHLEEERDRKRREWLRKLRGAVPRLELAIGKHLDCTADEYRQYATNFLQETEGFTDREALDFLAAFGSDACLLQKSERIEPTPFCFIKGSGHQYFLETVAQLMEKVSPEFIHATLFEPWTYPNEKLSMRWDPLEDRRYALMDRDPTASNNRTRTMWMANLLAYRALVLFPSTPRKKGLATTAWDQIAGDSSFTWPIWEQRADLDSIRSLILLSDLRTSDPKRTVLRSRGISAAFRSRRIQTRKYINFSRAREV